MSKIRLFAFVTIFLSGCASTPKSAISPFKLTSNDIPAASLTGKKYYSIAKVDINFRQILVNPDFYTEAQLKSKFSAELERQLKALSLLVTGSESPVLLSTTFNYKRTYMGEAFGMSKQLGGGTCQVNATIEMKDKNVTATYATDLSIIGPSGLGILKKLSETVMSQVDQATEEDKAIRLCVEDIVKVLPR